MSKDIFWCKTCLNMSTRPRVEFDESGSCNACVWKEEKKTKDWTPRQDELKELLNKYRSKDGSFDCIVPVSGGKDGSYVSHMLKHEFGMHPLAITVVSPLSFNIGDQNLENYINSGYDHIRISPNPLVMKEINKKGFIEQGRPLFGWTTAIFSSVFRTAVNFKIPLVFYGEDGEVEYGGSTETKNRALMEFDYIRKVYLEGGYQKTIEGMFSQEELYFWQFPSVDELGGRDLFSTHWSYFEAWDSYRNYMVAKDHCGLLEKEENNTGTYTNFAQNDNSLYNLHTYLMYLKFGFGRASQDAGIDIRRGAMTREQGRQLAMLYDNQPPEQFVSDYLAYYDMTREEYDAVIDSHANKDLFYKDGDMWMPKFEIE